MSRDSLWMHFIVGMFILILGLAVHSLFTSIVGAVLVAWLLFDAQSSDNEKEEE